MIVIVFLGILTSNLILTHGYVLAADSQSDDNDEERLVVNKLASIIRQEQEKLRDYSDHPENDDELPNETEEVASAPMAKSPSFTYQEPKPVQRKDVTRLNKEPIAVPPSDFRYFQKDFSVPDATSNQDSHQSQPKDEKIKIISALSAQQPESQLVNEAKTDSKKGDAVEHTEDEEVQRRRMYSHLMLNPSFIPYGGHPNSIRPQQGFNIENRNSTNLLAITYGTVCALLVITTVGAIMIYRKLRKKVKDAEEVDYPAYGVTGPCKETTAPTGDRHLAHSAQMYHYQHQKQQIIAMEKGTAAPPVTRKGTESGSEEDDMTVYECPGLAPVTGEMEVKNPMFQEEEDVKPSPASKESKSKRTHSDVNKKSSKK